MQDLINELIQAKAANHYRGMQKSLKALRDVHGVKVVGRLNCKKAVMIAIATQVIADLLPKNAPACFLEGEQAIFRALIDLAGRKRGQSERLLRTLSATVTSLYKAGEYNVAIALFRQAF